MMRVWLFITGFLSKTPFIGDQDGCKFYRQFMSVASQIADLQHDRIFVDHTCSFYQIKRPCVTAFHNFPAVIPSFLKKCYCTGGQPWLRKRK